jgi:hypothetical protein
LETSIADIANRAVFYHMTLWGYTINLRCNLIYMHPLHRVPGMSLKINLEFMYAFMFQIEFKP